MIKPSVFPGCDLASVAATSAQMTPSGIAPSAGGPPTSPAAAEPFSKGPAAPGRPAAGPFGTASELTPRPSGPPAVSATGMWSVSEPILPDPLQLAGTVDAIAAAPDGHEVAVVLALPAAVLLGIALLCLRLAIARRRKPRATLG